MKLRIGGVPEHFNYIWQLPESKEAFRNQGYYYEWTDFSGGTGAMVAALENQEIDVALMLTEGAIAAITNGKKFRIRQPFVMSPLVWGVFSSADREIGQLPAYEKANFAVSRLNSGSHLMAQFLAKRYSVSLVPEQFVVSNNLDGARLALKTRSADYFLWEKWMTRHLVHQGEFRETDEVSAPWPAFVAVSRRNEFDEWLPVLNAIDSSISYLNQLEPNEIISGLCKAFPLTETDAEEWIGTVKYYDGNGYWKDRLTVASLLLQNAGIIDRLPSLEELI